MLTKEQMQAGLSQAVLSPRKRAVIYCRVSTENQEQDGESLEYQEEKCRQYAELEGIDVLAVLSEAKSGFIHYSHREKLTLARQLIHDGIADVIIVFDLRRFSRNFVHSAMIFEEIEQAGGYVVSVSEKIDNSLTGKLVRSILAWSAESERHKIVEYANRHWQSRLEQGLPMATGRAPFGWNWADENKTYYTINPELAAIRFSLFYMFVDLDMSLRAISHKLTEDNIPPPSATRNEKKVAKGWRPETIRILMMDEKNIGTLTICKVTYVLTESGKKVSRPNKNMRKIPNAMPAIVDQERYDKAIRKLALNKVEKSHLPKDETAFLLRAGYVYCQECGIRMRAITDRKGGIEYHYYKCSNYGNKYINCSARTSINTLAADTIAWEECCRIFERLELIQETLENELEREAGILLSGSTMQQHILQIEAEIGYATEEQKRHLPGSYYYNLIAQDIQTKEAQLQRYKEEAEKATPLISRDNIYRQRIQRFIDFLRDMKGNYHQATYKEKREALYALGVKVYISKLPHLTHTADPQARQKIHITYSPVITGVNLSKDNTTPVSASSTEVNFTVSYDSPEPDAQNMNIQVNQFKLW